MIVKKGKLWSVQIEDVKPILPGSTYERPAWKVTLQATLSLRYPSVMKELNAKDAQVESHRKKGDLPNAQLNGWFLLGREPQWMSPDDLFDSGFLHLDKISQGIDNARYGVYEEVKTTSGAFSADAAHKFQTYGFRIDHPWFAATIHNWNEWQYHHLEIVRKKTLELYEHRTFRDNKYPEQKIDVPDRPENSSVLEVVQHTLFIYPELVALMPFPTLWDGKGFFRSGGLFGGSQQWRKGGNWIKGSGSGYGFPFTDVLTSHLG